MTGEGAKRGDGRARDTARKARLKSALKANMARRKAQARGRASEAAENEPGKGDGAPTDGAEQNRRG